MATQHYIIAVLLAVAMVTQAARAQDVQQPGGDITEEQLEQEVLFSVAEEIAEEIEGAVRTINEVFGNPDCVGSTDKRGASLAKRKLEKGWWKPAALELAKALIEGKKKRSVDGIAKRKLEKGWWKPAATQLVTALINGGKKRSVEGIAKRKLEKGWWKPAALELAKALINGKKKRSVDGIAKRKLEKGWWKPAALELSKALINGKKRRSVEGIEESVLRRRRWILAGKRQTQEEVPAVGSEDTETVEFEADLEKLADALGVLTDVLLVAQATEK